MLVTLAVSQVGATPRLDMRHVRADRGALVARDKDSDTWVRLTLDAGLQRASERLLERARAHEGAIVVSDVRTGRILVWATRGGSADLVSTPLAPSASLFKVVTAAALLEGGKVSPATRQCYAGGEKRIEEVDLDDDRARDDRCTNLGAALGHSVNLVFARLALKHLTPEALTHEAGPGAA